MDLGTFVLPSGKIVKPRRLTGWEVVMSRTVCEGDRMALNAYSIGAGLNDDPNGEIEPAVAAGKEWMMDHSAGDFQALSEEIQRLSDLGEGAGKS